MTAHYHPKQSHSKNSRANRTSFWRTQRSSRPTDLIQKSHQRNKVEIVPDGLVQQLGIGLKAQHHHKDAARNKKVVSSLFEFGDHKARHIGKQVKGCRAFVRVEGGEASAFIRYCNRRECATCSRKAQTKKRADLYKVINGLSGSGVSRFSFITLTMDRKRLDDVSCRNTFAVFRKQLSKFLNRPEYRAATDGTYYAIEATKNETWNIHAHLLVEHKGSRQELKRLVLRLWNNSLDVGSIIKVKKFTVSKKSICELVKYVVKDYSLTGQDFADFVSVIHGRRLTGATGSIRKGLKEIKEKSKTIDDIVIPSPPRRPDGIDVPDGNYGLERIYTMAIMKEPLGIYLFRLLEYRARWGYKYEVRASLDNTGSEGQVKEE